MTKLHLSETDKVISGVCGGLGESTGIDSSLFRIAFAISILIGGTGLVAYIILALVLPRDKEGKYKIENDEPNGEKFYRSWNDRMIGGICGGIADKTGIDTSLVRLVFVIFLLMGGIGLPVYLIMWFVLPLKRTED